MLDKCLYIVRICVCLLITLKQLITSFLLVETGSSYFSLY